MSAQAPAIDQLPRSGGDPAPARSPTIDVVAPISGVVVPLASVPDQVFANRLVGDGVAIDPTSSEVLAPATGTITQLHRGHHALVIATDAGVEVMIHVGLDTITLDGRGFTPLVAQGARVDLGAPVLRLDLDWLARNARSLLTEVVITSADKIGRLTCATGLVEAGKTVLLSAELTEQGGVEALPGLGDDTYSAWVTLPNPAGLHARPAAMLATEAKKYEATIRIVRGGDEANAKSVVAIMGLSTRHGEVVRVKASGPDAQRAADDLSRLLAEGCGEKPGDAPRPTLATGSSTPLVVRPARREGELAGVAASPGLAVGRVFHWRRSSINVTEAGRTLKVERESLTRALRDAGDEIRELQGRISDRSKAQIMDVHLALLEDPDLILLTEALLAKGKSAAFAWQEAYAACSARLERLDNQVLRQRAVDMRDVGRRVLGLLTGTDEQKVDVPARSIIVAEDLTPSETASLDRERVLGFCTTSGGATSHVAILARSLGIPAVVGIDESALDLHDGAEVVVDGTRGTLRPNPTEDYLAEVRLRMERLAARRDRERSAAFTVARTKDGHRVEVGANIRNADDAHAAVAAGAEGVGLLRSEFLFDERSVAPSEDEQAAAYLAVAEALGPERPLVIRTLDVGGDKPLAYLPQAHEDNPFLGVRGIRVSLESPTIFRTQLRAILRAAPAGDVHVMFPMVARLEELRAAKEILAEEQVAVPYSVKVGVMIEVPAAAAMAEVLAREVDFFSIGTNDLTQYVLAMDRGHPKLAKHADALHPAVLRLIAMTVEGAHRHHRWVGVCGGLASEPIAIPLLVGLGLDELSVAVPAIATVKARLAQLGIDECRALAEKAVACGTTAEVRGLLAPYAE